MMARLATLFRGEVVHLRLRPKRHRLAYRVLAIGIDVDRIGDALARLRLLRHNGAGLVALHDRDHGAGDGQPLADQARSALARAGLSSAGHRIDLVTCPRVFGYVFNPLSVFLCYDVRGALAAVIYEVSNTMRERTCYVLPAGDCQAGTYAHSCAKAMYVSPFTPAQLDYGFRIKCTTHALTVGVNLRDGAGPLLRAHLHAETAPLTDVALARALAASPLTTLKVTAAIHYEALRLYLKRVPVVRYRPSPRFSIVTAAPASEHEDSRKGGR
ncbi:MAG: DUF1365 domain-containing protein [Hyphomicrobiaceae bacterium]